MELIFKNDSDLPIILSSWNYDSIELLIYKNKTVLPNTECIINDSLGEWFLSTPYENEEHLQIWIDKQLEYNYEIGKFRSNSCIMGSNSWMNTNIFNIKFENNIFIFNYSHLLN